MISYSVTRRTQEIGIRMALGASAGNVQARILSETLKLAAAGILVGALISWILARALTGLLFGVILRLDPATFLAMLLCWRRSRVSLDTFRLAALRGLIR